MASAEPDSIEKPSAEEKEVGELELQLRLAREARKETSPLRILHAGDDVSVMESAFATMKSIIAGGLAGMIAKSVVAPVDRIKILFQVSTERFSVSGVVRTMGRIHREEGIAGLWKGNSATMLRVFPYAGIQFMTFDKTKAYILRYKGEPVGQLTNIESLLAGSFAGFVSCTFTYPLDFARARLAVEGGSSLNVLYIWKTAYREGGITSLYRGITPTLLGILPYAGIAFTVNDKANHQIKSITGHDPTTIQKLACGAFAGLAAQSATYPLDVVRRRMQTSGIVSTGGSSVEGSLYGKAQAAAAVAAGAVSGGQRQQQQILMKHATMLQILKQVYREEGFRGLFKGLSMNWIKGPIALSISFTTFDYLKRYLNVPKTPGAR